MKDKGRSSFVLVRRVWYQFGDAGRMQGLVGLGRARTLSFDIRD